MRIFFLIALDLQAAPSSLTPQPPQQVTQNQLSAAAGMPQQPPGQQHKQKVVDVDFREARNSLNKLRNYSFYFSRIRMSVESTEREVGQMKKRRSRK